MGALVDLSSDAYWESDIPDLRLNPALGNAPAGLEEFLQGEPALRGHVVFQTSGSGGDPKYVCLLKTALLAGAKSAQEHLGLRADDVWLRALPTFHVGGFSIHARARVTGAKVVACEEAWDAGGFQEVIESAGASWVSLVPTQLFDLVALGVSAPACLRGVLIGGAALESDLAAKARDLGWPLFPTFGMTEAGSQIATAKEGSEALCLLPGWEAREDEGERLSIRSAALFSGYVEKVSGGWQFRDPKDGSGWFETTDRVRLDGQCLTPLGRAGDVVKILGELVDLGRLREQLATLVPVERAIIMTRPCPRAGCKLIAVFAGEIDASVVGRFNEMVAPFERITESETVPSIPISPLGKVMYGRLGDS